MINNSKSTEKFIKENTNQLRLKLQNKKSEAETKFAQLLTKANVYFMREKTNYKFGTRWCFFDFWLPKLRIYVEIDGAEHSTAEQQQIDREKEKIIKDKQMFVARFTNEEVLNMNEITEDFIIDRMVQCSMKRKKKHRNFDVIRDKYLSQVKEVQDGVRQNVTRVKWNRIDIDKKVYLYDHFIGEYFVFDNIIELKVTLGKGHTIEEFLYMLEDCEYNPKSNRRYVCAYSQSECELRVLKAFC